MQVAPVHIPTDSCREIGHVVPTVSEPIVTLLHSFHFQFQLKMAS